MKNKNYEYYKNIYRHYTNTNINMSDEQLLLVLDPDFVKMLKERKNVRNK